MPKPNLDTTVPRNKYRTSIKRASSDLREKSRPFNHRDVMRRSTRAHCRQKQARLSRYTAKTSVVLSPSVRSGFAIRFIILTCRFLSLRCLSSLLSVSLCCHSNHASSKMLQFVRFPFSFLSCCFLSLSSPEPTSTNAVEPSFSLLLFS